MSRPPSRGQPDPPQALSLSASPPGVSRDHQVPPEPKPRNKEKPPTWIPIRSTQAQVSIFTGRTDPPFSPPRTTGPEEPYPALTPGSIDRVFPVRSAVSIDPLATPLLRGEHDGGFPGMRPAARSRVSTQGTKSTTPRRSSEAMSTSANSEAGPGSDDSGCTPITNTAMTNIDAQIFGQILADGQSQTSEVSSIAGGDLAATQHDTAPLVTARFKHVVTDGGHTVITGRDGETLQRCEDEPIHIPGAVQGFGLLIALREEGENFVVRVASENSVQIIGYTPQQLFTLDSFLGILSDDQAENVLDHVDFIRDEGAGGVVLNGPEVFIISVRPPQSRTRKLWCAMHLCESDPSLIICEFEMEDDQVNPLSAKTDGTPEIPEDTLGSQPTEEELLDSTVNVSKPLRVLRSARKKRTEAAAMEVFNIMSQVQEQLSTAPNLPAFLKVLIGIVKELTGFHRVMIYQFDQAWNGRVVAELIDPRATRDLYKGLNFPASDIPRQARELYKINKVRLLYDRDQETARLVCRSMEDLENPLDMTHANLRAMSPIHLKYLANMSVRSSMSISINAFNELWGLIACHSYGEKPRRVSFPIRKMCRLVGDTASRNIERLSYASRLQARKLINTTSSATNPSGYIVASSEDLLKLFDADVGALSIRDETKIMGDSRGHLQEVLAMVEYLRMRKMVSVFCSHDIANDFPDLRYEPGWKYLAGLLYVPLASGGSDFIAFFRKGALQEVKWAGNPYEKFVREGTEGYLEPRTSFKVWSEMIVGRCRDWTDEEVETAAVLRLVYGKFIDVWRQKEAALQNSKLTRLLLANSAHEVRTPLNAIINYLEIALEGQLDQDTRENLARSHSASKSLVYVINDLLDLTKAEDGQSLVKTESLDLLQALKEATDPFVGDARRKNLQYDVSIDAGVPQHVIGDHRRVRQLVSNLVANAIQNTHAGNVIVQVSVMDGPQPLGGTEIQIVVADSGVGMSQEQVNALFRELEEVSFEEDVSGTEILSADPFSDRSDKQQAMLGLGLAVVARTIRAMNGQLRVKTEQGRGSRFVLVLGFRVPVREAAPLEPSVSQSRPVSRPNTAASQGPKEGEVTLVYRNPKSHHGAAHLERRESTHSTKSRPSLHSGKSFNSVQSESSQISDADRLISAIQQPLRWTNEQDGTPDTVSKGERNSVTTIGSPTMPLKTGGLSSPRALGSSDLGPGVEQIVDSGTPLRPIRMLADHVDESSGLKVGAKVPFEDRLQSAGARSDTAEEQQPLSTLGFTVLVAEDDPINSRIMKKRLEKLGHSVHMTVNGEECSFAHGEQPASFDAVLMDLQMPIVDGFSSTKMIRSLEKTHPNTCLSGRATHNGRIPIFAVSASLVEKDREKYVQTGFDGWILKPVDFRRVNLLLKGIVDHGAREDCLYGPGMWEHGGWFESRQAGRDAFAVDTQPSQKKPTFEAEQSRQEGVSEVRSADSSPPSDATEIPHADAS